jgi:hypothetical protein
MKQKTTLNQLLEMLDGRIEYFNSRQMTYVSDVLKGVKVKAESLLPEERKAIEDAFVAGDERGTGDIPFNAEQYFSQTFETHNS